MIKKFESFKHGEFSDYNMNEKTIKYLLDKCKDFPYVTETRLVYLSDEGHGGGHHCINWDYKSKDEDIPVVFLYFYTNVLLGSMLIDRVNYSMFIWTEVDNYISSVTIRDDDSENQLDEIYLEYSEINRTTMEDFFKMLKTGPNLKH